MKKILIFTCSLCIFFISCKKENGENTTKNNQKLILEGALELVSYYNYTDNKVSDTIYRSDDFKQIKMYTESKVMWSRSVPNDSLEWFGYGSYEFSDSTLFEALDYGSKTMNLIVNSRTEFEFQLFLEKDRFTQIEINEDGSPIYAENFVRIE